MHCSRLRVLHPSHDAPRSLFARTKAAPWDEAVFIPFLEIIVLLIVWALPYVRGIFCFKCAENPAEALATQAMNQPRSQETANLAKMADVKRCGKADMIRLAAEGINCRLQVAGCGWRVAG